MAFYLQEIPMTAIYNILETSFITFRNLLRHLHYYCLILILPKQSNRMQVNKGKNQNLPYTFHFITLRL